MRAIKQMLITVAVLLCSATASAYDFEVDGIYYNILSMSDLTVEVTKGDNEYSGEVIIPSTVSYKSKALTVTSIGWQAFNKCSGLTSVTIGNSVTSIGESAFKGCSGLTSVTIPNSVTSIGEYAFYGCSTLKDVHISDLSAWCNIQHNMYSNPLHCAQNFYLNGELLVDIVIPDDVTEIKNEAFSGFGLYGSHGIRSVTIPNSVTRIGENAFLACLNLKTVINYSNLSISKGSLENGRVGQYADKVINAPNGSLEGDFIFAKIDGCNTLCAYISNVKELTLPGNYKDENYVIGNDAFYGCSEIISIKFTSAQPPKVGVGNFTSLQYQNVVLYVPKGALAAYQSADVWKEFWEIVEYDVTAIENVEDVTPAFEITSSGIQFTAADGKAIAIYAPNGALVEKIDNYAGEEIALDKGVYIVRVGNKTMKIRL